MTTSTDELDAVITQCIELCGKDAERLPADGQLQELRRLLEEYQCKTTQTAEGCSRTNRRWAGQLQRLAERILRVPVNKVPSSTTSLALLILAEGIQVLLLLIGRGERVDIPKYAICLSFLFGVTHYFAPHSNSYCRMSISTFSPIIISSVASLGFL